MWVILKETTTISGNYYDYLTNQLRWESDRNNAKEFPTKNSALVQLTKLGLQKKENIIIVDD